MGEIVFMGRMLGPGEHRQQAGCREEMQLGLALTSR
jgi:hypothetical protein